MSEFDKQIGGTHYKDMAIQPLEFIERNGLGYAVGNVIKYVCRWRKDSGSGIEDLKKAKHYIDLLIELELEDDILDRVEVIDSSDPTDLDYRLEVIEIGDVAAGSDPGWTDRLT
jgi:hypothetical protein|tara:strand:- start:138 stop:479 length:342 start_codon:yes stop_codon:yes gene_type:complete